MVVDTEEYSKWATEKAELQSRLKTAATKLREAINRSHRLEDAILSYLGEADRTGTMNPKNLRILRDVVTRK